MSVGRFEKFWKKYDVFDNLELLLRAKRGVEIDCFMNWTSLIPNLKMDIIGTSGKISVELMKKPFRVSIESNNSKKIIDKKGLGKYLDLVRFKHPGFKEMYFHLYRLIEGFETPKFTIDDEIKILEAIDKVTQALYANNKT